MNKLGASLFLLTAFTVFSAASCASDVPQTTISELTIATGIKFNNQPENTTDTVAAGTEEIYLTGRIMDHTRSTVVRVRWMKLPNFIVSSEDFDGRGSTADKFDFDQTKPVSYFASRIQKEGVTWQTGEYRAEVFLDNEKVETLNFKIVPDAEAEAINTRNAISRVFFGSRLTDEEVIAQSETSFTRSTENIHIQIVPGRMTNGSQVEVTVKHVRDQKILNTSNIVFAGEENLLISMPRSRFGKFWSDGLWATGVYEVGVKVNSVPANTYTFSVR